MKRDAGDIVDRFAIATLKLVNICKEESWLEYVMFSNGFMDLCERHPKSNLTNYLYKMILINREIWNLESDVRQGALDNDPTEVGKRAIRIRGKNSIRINIKNEINKLVGEGVQDVRRNHLSQIEE